MADEDGIQRQIDNLEGVINFLSSSAIDEDCLRNSVLFAVIFDLMVDSGFVLVTPSGSTRKNEQFIEVFKALESKPTKLFLPMVLQKFPDCRANIILTPMGDVALVNCVLADMEGQTFSLAIRVKQYIVNPLAPKKADRFRSLENLAITFKNSIASAARSTIMQYHGYVNASLLGLPEDILVNMLKHLNVRSVLNVSQTCRYFNNIGKDQRLWKYMFNRDLKNKTEHAIVENEVDWKNVYMHCFNIYKDRVAARASFTSNNSGLSYYDPEFTLFNFVSTWGMRPDIIDL